MFQVNTFEIFHTLWPMRSVNVLYFIIMYCLVYHKHIINVKVLVSDHIKYHKIYEKTDVNPRTQKACWGQ